jgi:hypothetical protein
MSGSNAFKYNNNSIINSFYDIASINLPTTQTYTTNQYNVLAPPTIDGSAGYVLQTSNNIISIDNSGGFSINNVGFYKISFCFSFDSSNYTSTSANNKTIQTDFMLNATYPYTSSDIVGSNSILNVNASGTALSNTAFNFINVGSIANYYNQKYSNYTYDWFLNPSIMYYSDTSVSTDPYFTFARYYLSPISSGFSPQVLYFESNVTIVSTFPKNNTFYPCICPYDYTIWNTGNNTLPQPYLMVQMISSI